MIYKFVFLYLLFCWGLLCKLTLDLWLIIKNLLTTRIDSLDFNFMYVFCLIFFIHSLQVCSTLILCVFFAHLFHRSGWGRYGSFIQSNIRVPSIKYSPLLQTVTLCMLRVYIV